MTTKSEQQPMQITHRMNMQGTVTGRVLASDLNHSNTPKSNNTDVKEPEYTEGQKHVAYNMLIDDACNVVRSVALYGNIFGKETADAQPAHIPVPSHFRSAMIRGYISELLHPQGMRTHRVNQSGINILLKRKVADDEALRKLGI